MKYLVFLMCVIGSINSYALGQKLTVYSETQGGGIWDHEKEFYVVTDLDGFGAVRAELYQDSQNKFSGTIQYYQNGQQLSRKASAKLLNHEGEVKYFLLHIEGLDKELILKKN